MILDVSGDPDTDGTKYSSPFIPKYIVEATATIRTIPLFSFSINTGNWHVAQSAAVPLNQRPAHRYNASLSYPNPEVKRGRSFVTQPRLQRYYA